MDEPREREIKPYIPEELSRPVQRPETPPDEAGPETPELFAPGAEAAEAPPRAEDAAPEVPEIPDAPVVPVVLKKANAPVIPEAADVPAVPEDAPEEPRGAAEESPAKPLSSAEVTAHTAGLWKYLPVPDTEPEQSPEYLTSDAVYPASRITAARVRGKKHKHEGTCCDDWFETAHFEDITLVAVSDGAGSKRFSRIGAKASCQAAVGYLLQALAAVSGENPALRAELRLPLDDPRCVKACTALAERVQQSVLKAWEAVESACYARTIDPAFQEALGRKLDVRDLSATLLIAVAVPLDRETKEHLVVSCQVGDGMIAVLNTEGPFSSSLKLMGEPDGGDFSGETDFLTSPKMRQLETLQGRTRISRGVFDTVMVMTDGVSDDYFPNETELRRLYYDLAANGILEGKTPALDPASQGRLLQLCRRIPAPQAYPWVNDQSVSISLHYMDCVCEATGLSLEDVWNDPTVLSLCRTEMDPRVKDETPGGRLRLWLDNYVRRGSFDDRTLVIATLL